MEETVNNFSATPAREEASVPVRDVDIATAEAELRLHFNEFQSMLKSLDEAEIVTQETLQLEFSV
jgi:hypothetical protein